MSAKPSDCIIYPPLPAGLFEFLSAHKNVSNQVPDVFAGRIYASNINCKLNSSSNTVQIQVSSKLYVTFKTITNQLVGDRCVK